MPSQYIYEPWTAPVTVQKEAGCIIRKDYPTPMVKHNAVCQANKRLMGDAIAEMKHRQKSIDGARKANAKRKAAD